MAFLLLALGYNGHADETKTETKATNSSSPSATSQTKKAEAGKGKDMFAVFETNKGKFKYIQNEN